MQVTETGIADLKIIEPKFFGDDRGFFFESFNQKVFDQVIPGNFQFVQDNHSKSAKGVLRGLHYQLEHAQGKLVRVVSGEVFDVAVDVRKKSPTFGKWFGLVLSAANKKMLWVPPGFAHGFLVLSDSADFLYKTTEYYHPASEKCIIWNDPKLNIEWPKIDCEPCLSVKDKLGQNFENAEVFE